MQVIVDAVDDEGATCRTKADAPEIDGNLFIDEGFEGLAPGDMVEVEVDEAANTISGGGAAIARAALEARLARPAVSGPRAFVTAGPRLSG
jgi:hypothetical protein